MLHPTGSLYGLAVDAHNAHAVARLKALKGIEEGVHPFVLLIDAAWVETIVALHKMSEPSRARARRLVATHWPGGLTLIVPASDAPEAACAFTDMGSTIAIRADDHPIAIALCQGFGGPIISTSANLHGASAPLQLNQVPASLRENSVLLDGTPPPLGTPSTVLDFSTDPPSILRIGRVPSSALE